MSLCLPAGISVPAEVEKFLATSAESIVIDGERRPARAGRTIESVDPATGAPLVGKRGRVVATAIAHPTDVKVDMSLFELTLYEKQLRGCVFGSANPHADIPRLLSLYRSGALKLDELVTRTYTLNEVNEGYQDMFAGLNIRGVLYHSG